MFVLTPRRRCSSDCIRSSPNILLYVSFEESSHPFRQQNFLYSNLLGMCSYEPFFIYSLRYISFFSEKTYRFPHSEIFWTPLRSQANFTYLSGFPIENFLKVLINRCLGKIIRIFWLNAIRNTNLLHPKFSEARCFPTQHKEPIHKVVGV